MLAKRIIPCLDIKDGQTVKGTNFVNLRQAGDPVELARAYSEQGADELVFLDITASFEGRKTFAELVKRIAANISIPFTVGGGINELSDVDRLLNAGADKISINSSAIRRPELIDEIAKSEVAVNVHFIPMPMLTLFKNLGYKIEDYPQAYNNYKGEISLPIYPQLTDEQVKFVIDTVVNAYNKVK
mgnify:CR=1 FL=1